MIFWSKYEKLLRLDKAGCYIPTLYFLLYFPVFFLYSVTKNIWTFFSWSPFRLIQERVKCNLEGFSGSSPPKGGHARQQMTRESEAAFTLMNTNGETAGPARFPREAGWRLDFSIIHKISYSAHG